MRYTRRTMAGRSSSPPLFEVLERQRARSDDRPVRVEAPEPRAEGAEPRVRRLGELVVADGRVVLPVSYAYISLASIIVLGLLVWTLAYSAGARAKHEAMLDQWSRGRPGVQDPLVAEPETQRPPTGASNTPVESRPAATPSSGLPPVLTASGPISEDPRQPGLNYLHLATSLTRGEAEGVVVFLGSNGLEALAIPLDRTGGGANNPVRFQLVLAEGFEGSQFNATKPRRDDLVRRAQALGQRWQREMKGSTSFPSPQWTKYSP